MIYQVTANLYFDVEDKAFNFFHDCELAYLKSTICNPDTDAAEYGIKWDFMTIKIKDLIYWYRQFRSLLSGWTPQEQIQFHQHAILQLQHEIEKRGR